MTKEEAIEIIGNEKRRYEMHLNGSEEVDVYYEVMNAFVKAYDMAIKALEKHTEERTETHACDCISREAALEILDDYAEDIESGNWETAYSKARTRMCELQPVMPQQKIGQGQWIDDKCSVCGKGTEDLISSSEWYRNEDPNFCPFCGAKMEVSTHE